MSQGHLQDSQKASAALNLETAKLEMVDDWRDIFYLTVFLDLSFTHGLVMRRKQVWIKRFLANRDKPHLYRRMAEIIQNSRCDQDELLRLGNRAAAELSMGEKRRFIYNLAQLFQSKGTLSTPKYERILNLAEKLGLPDTEADAMLHSVNRINDTFITVIGLLAGGTIIYLTRTVLIPLVIAILLTMIINRIELRIASLFSLGRFRWLTKLAAMVVILAIMFGLVMATMISAADIVNRFPEYAARSNLALSESETAQSILAWLGPTGILGQLKQLPVGDLVSSWLASLINLLSNFVLVVIFTAFLVFSSTAFKGVLAEMGKRVGTYISIKSLLCLLTGLAVFFLCSAFGVDFALFWALLAFLLNFIPVVGAIIASLPPILLAMVQLSFWPTVIFIPSMILLNVLLGQVIEPKLMGQGLLIKPVAILLGLIFWGLLWGLPGMFLATPLMVLLRILASYFNFSRSFERLLATETT